MKYTISILSIILAATVLRAGTTWITPDGYILFTSPHPVNAEYIIVLSPGTPRPTPFYQPGRIFTTPAPHTTQAYTGLGAPR